MPTKQFGVAFNPATTPLDGTETLSIVQGGVTVDCTTQDIADLGGGSGSPAVFDVLDYGAVWDNVTDDTAAVQAAIDAAGAAGGGIIQYPLGIGFIGGALQDPSRSNAQLLLPFIDYVDSKQITIEFRGAVPPPCVFSVIGTTPVPDTHTIIRSGLNAGVGGALLGAWGPVGTFGNFTNVQFVARNIAFRMPSNPVLTALNLATVAAVELDDVVVDCGSYYIQGLTEPTTASSFAIRMPGNNNGALSKLGTVNVAGFYNGYEFAEHCTGFGTQAAWGCKRAFVFATATNHAQYFERLMAVHCERVLVSTGITYVDIGQLNLEHAASGWWVTDFDVDDANNYLVGSIMGWHVVLAGTGVDSTFTVNGAARLNITRLGWHNRLETLNVSAAITFEGRHANKRILHPSADTTARVWTIPSNASVPYPIGTTLAFGNQNGAGALTIAITSDTMYLAGSGSTGSRTLAANGSAVAVKETSTVWQISGVGLT